MNAKGVYRDKAVTGVEFAHVDFGVRDVTEEVARSLYEARVTRLHL